MKSAFMAALAAAALALVATAAVSATAPTPRHAASHKNDHAKPVALPVRHAHKAKTRAKPEAEIVYHGRHYRLAETPVRGRHAHAVGHARSSKTSHGERHAHGHAHAKPAPVGRHAHKDRHAHADRHSKKASAKHRSCGWRRHHWTCT